MKLGARTEWCAAIFELKFHAREERKIQEPLVSAGTAGKGEGKCVRRIRKMSFGPRSERELYSFFEMRKVHLQKQTNPVIKINKPTPV